MTSLQTNNIYAALGAVKGGKKKSSKSKEDGGEKKKKQSKAEEKSQLEAAIFSGQPSVSNWADELSEDDDFDGGLGALPDGWSAVSLVIVYRCAMTSPTVHILERLYNDIALLPCQIQSVFPAMQYLHGLENDSCASALSNTCDCYQCVQ